MICKVILVVAAAFVAVQSFSVQGNGETANFQLTAIIDGFIQLAENQKNIENDEVIESVLRELSKVFPAPDKALLQLKALIDSSINNATIKLKGLSNDLAEKAHNTVAQSNVTLRQEADSLLDEVAVLEAESKALGINATHCTQGTNPPIDKLPSLFTGKLDECQGDKINQGEDLIQSAQSTLKYAYVTVQQFTDDLKLCDKQIGVRVKLCRARVGLNIVNATESLPVQISNVVVDSIQLISSVYSEVQICTVTVNRDFLNQGKQIIDGIESCIDREINFNDEN